MEEVRSYWQVASITHFCNLFGRPFKLPTFEPEELEQAFIIDVPQPPKNVANNQNINDSNHHITNNNNHNNNINHNNNNNNDIESPNEPDNNSNNSGDHLDNDNRNGDDRLPLSVDGDDDQEKCNGEDKNESNEECEDVDKKEEPKQQQKQLHDELVEEDGKDEDEDEEEDDGDDDQEESRPRKRRSDDPSFKPPPSLMNYQPVQPPQPQADEPEMHLLVKLGIALLKPHFNSKLTPTNWENYLYRLIDIYWVELEHHPSPFRLPIITPDGIELTKNLTFNELPLSDKIDVFYALCDYRFWCEDASDCIKDYPIEDLRLESIGKDSQGYEYWYFWGTRLFREDKELSQDLILRKKRIKELEYKLIELEKARILKEQEEKRKAELERAKQLALEAKEARLTAKKRQQDEAADNCSGSGSARKRRNNTPILPPRTGLRERRSSAASNNNDSQLQPRTTRSKVARQSTEQSQPQSAQKTSRGSSKNSKQTEQETKPKTPEPPKKAPIEECKEELERIAVKSEDRAAAWCIHCESLEEWESFSVRFEKTKSTNEKYLSNYVNQEIMPRIRSIYAKRAAEARRKEKELILALASRRVSSRIISKRAQEEEEERQAKIREAEMLKKKAEAEIRLRAELEQEMRAKRNRERAAAMAAASAALSAKPETNGRGATSSTCSDDVASGGGGVDEESNGRYNLRQQQQPHQHQHYSHQKQNQEYHRLGINNLEYYDGSHDFDGIIHPDKLSEFYEALELIIDTVKTSKHAWPFVDPVPNTVPGYYDLIEEPMDIKKLRTKVEFREYKSLIELEKDFQLLVNNCEKFNGPKNVYTKMVYKLWKSFRKNVRLYLQRDLHMDEFETFIYPPQVPAAQAAPPQQQPPSPPPPATTLEKKEAIDDKLTNNDSKVIVQNGVLNHPCADQKDPTTTTNNELNESSVCNDGHNQNGLIEDEKFKSNMNDRNNVVTVKEEVINSVVVNGPAVDRNDLTWNNHQNPKLETTTTPVINNSMAQEVPMDSSIIEEIIMEPPEPVVEEVIIDSGPCSGETYFIWPQDTKPLAQQDR